MAKFAVSGPDTNGASIGILIDSFNELHVGGGHAGNTVGGMLGSELAGIASAESGQRSSLGETKDNIDRAASGGAEPDWMAIERGWSEFSNGFCGSGSLVQGQDNSATRVAALSNNEACHLMDADMPMAFCAGTEMRATTQSGGANDEKPTATASADKPGNAQETATMPLDDEDLISFD
jgi:hypothetical protein